MAEDSVDEIKNEIGTPGEKFDPSKAGKWTIPEIDRAPKTPGSESQPVIPPLKQAEPVPYDPNAPKEKPPVTNLSEMPTMANPTTPKVPEPGKNPISGIFGKLGGIFKRST